MAKTPVRYSPELADLILSRLAEGEGLKTICRDPGMPDSAAVRKWAREDVDGFGPRYARAREDQAHALADDILDLASSEKDPQLMTAIFNVKRWSASKILPKVFGEKMEVDQTTRSAVVSAEPTTDEWLAKHGRSA